MRWFILFLFLVMSCSGKQTPTELIEADTVDIEATEEEVPEETPVEKEPVEDSIEYYKGTVSYTFPGREKPMVDYGVLKRQLHKSKGTITETYTFPEQTNQITLIFDGDNVFHWNTGSSGGTGELVFEGARFDWDTWTESNITDTGTTKSTGTKTENGFTRTSTYTGIGENDNLTAKIVSEYESIDKQTYEDESLTIIKSRK